VESQTQRGSRDETIDDIAAAVRGVISQHVHRGADDIALDAGLESQLEIDSMAMIQINVSLEERFGIAMPDLAIDAGVSTVRDLVQYIHTRVSEARRWPSGTTW